MSKQSKNIILGYFTCTDPVKVNKFQNLLDSYWHKDEGRVITNIDLNGTTIEITDVDGDGNETVTTIDQYQEPATFAIAKIAGLQTAMDNLVSKVVGKGLSTEDFTTALKTKLDGLVNYVHPNEHGIGEITGLQDALDNITGELNTLNGLISGMNQQQYIIWHGYRLYKMGGGVLPTPEPADEIQGRGDGTLEGGDNVHLEVVNAIPDIALVVTPDADPVNKDYSILNKWA